MHPAQRTADRAIVLSLLAAVAALAFTALAVVTGQPVWLFGTCINASIGLTAFVVALCTATPSRR